MIVCPPSVIGNALTRTYPFPPLPAAVGDPPGAAEPADSTAPVNADCTSSPTILSIISAPAPPPPPDFSTAFPV